MAASQAQLVTLAVDGNVLLVASLQLLDGSLDVLHATLNTHLLAGEVGVQTGTVPVTGDRLGLEGNLGAEFLSHTVEKEATHPEMVTHLDTLARANLELPLGRHNLGVSAGDLDTGVQAGLVMGLDDITANNLASTNTAVVRTLGSRETSLGPAIGPVLHVEKSVFLLKTEPGLVRSMCRHQLVALMTVVVLVGGAIGIPALGEDKDVRNAPERVGEDSDGLQVDIRVVARSLVGGGAIEIPGGEVLGLETALRNRGHGL